MEGKGVKVPLSVVVMVVLILGLNLAQTHVEAKSCCPTTTARNCYNACRFVHNSREFCAKLCGCTIVPGTKCPFDYPSLHFCESGCASSMCSTISTLENSGKIYLIFFFLYLFVTKDSILMRVVLVGH
ncbi:putative thionin [Dioscorea sansibarensis]